MARCCQPEQWVTQGHQGSPPVDGPFEPKGLDLFSGINTVETRLYWQSFWCQFLCHENICHAMIGSALCRHNDLHNLHSPSGSLTCPVWDLCCSQIKSKWSYPLLLGLFVSVFRVVVQLLSYFWPFVTPWTAACLAFLSFTVSWSLLKLMSIESVTPSNQLIRCHPLLLLPSAFPALERRLLKQGHGMNRDLDGKKISVFPPSLKFSSYAKNAVNSSQNYPRWQALAGVHRVQATLGKTEAVALPYEGLYFTPFSANFTTKQFL